MAQRKKWKRVLITFIILILLLITGGLFALPATMIHGMARHHMEVEVFSPSDYNVSATSLTLQTSDHLNLAAWHVQTNAPKGTVIILSGIQNPSVTAFFGYAKMLYDYGYDSLLIETRGHGDSDGDYVGLGMKDWLDVKAGVDYLSQDTLLRDLPIVTLGTSMGGAVGLVALGEIPELDGAISLSPYSSFTEIFADQMLLSGAPEEFISLDKPFISLYLGLTYGFSNLKYSPLNAMEKLNGRPVLLMHSTEDSQVPYTNFERLMAVAPKSVETFIREGDEHFICYEEYSTDPTGDKAFSDSILTFLDKHFGH